LGSQNHQHLGRREARPGWEKREEVEGMSRGRSPRLETRGARRNRRRQGRRQAARVRAAELLRCVFGDGKRLCGRVSTSRSSGWRRLHLKVLCCRESTGVNAGDGRRSARHGSVAHFYRARQQRCKSTRVSSGDKLYRGVGIP
jgi:hypothetical protein